MSILKSMQAAASGLAAHGNAVDVVSDNISNVNTVGFKASRGRFEEVLGATVARGRVLGSTGLGSRLAGVDQMFTQGAMLGTGVGTDLAIQGDGFFMVKGSFDGLDSTFYTRAGQFNVSQDGSLRNPNGLMVQGYMADAQGVLGSSITDIVIPTQDAPPSATTAATLSANLDAMAPIPAAFDPLNAGTTSNFSSSLVAYDSLGGAHNVDVFFRRSGAGAYEWHALVDGGELTGGTAGVPTEIASGNLTFNTQGALDTETVVASSANFLNATAAQVIAFDFGDSITTDGGTGRTGSTSYASTSVTNEISQNGYSSGSLADISIAEDGTVTGTFTNGDRRTLSQVGLARFRNNGGLARTGGGLYIGSEESGTALVGAAGTGGRGAIVSEALEGSNVDLAQEFVNLISYQRGFQANSKTIRTADEMLSEVINIKR